MNLNLLIVLAVAMPKFLSIFLSIIVAILVLLVMVTVHEFGHYIAGKILKFKIDEFSIGFGMPIFSKRLKNGEKFSLRILPLGGYCAFSGETNAAESIKKSNEKQIENASKVGMACDAKKRVYVEDAQLANKCGQNVDNSKDNFIDLSAKSSQNVDNSSVLNDNVDKRGSKAFFEQPPWKRLIVLFSGAFMNFVFAILIVVMAFSIFGQFTYSVSKVLPSAKGEAVDESLMLKENDKIISINGKNIYLNQDIARAARGVVANEFVEVEIIRDGERIKKNVVWRNYVYQVTENGEEKEMHGVGFGINIGLENTKYGFFETIGRAFSYCFRLVYETLLIPGKIIVGIIGIENLGGPVATITLTAQFARLGLNYLLEVAAMLGISLAVFNLLPLPSLDGARMVFVGIEWMRGKPISPKVENAIHSIGLCALFALVIIVDVLHFVS